MAGAVTCLCASLILISLFHTSIGQSCCFGFEERNGKCYGNSNQSTLSYQDAKFICATSVYPPAEVIEWENDLTTMEEVASVVRGKLPVGSPDVEIFLGVVTSLDPYKWQSGTVVDAALTGEPLSNCPGFNKNDLPIVAQSVSQTDTKFRCLVTSKQAGINYLPPDSSVQVWCQYPTVTDQRECSPSSGTTVAEEPSKTNSTTVGAVPKLTSILQSLITSAVNPSSTAQKLAMNTPIIQLPELPTNLSITTLPILNDTMVSTTTTEIVTTTGKKSNRPGKDSLDDEEEKEKRKKLNQGVGIGVGTTSAVLVVVGGTIIAIKKSGRVLSASLKGNKLGHADGANGKSHPHAIA